MRQIDSEHYSEYIKCDTNHCLTMDWIDYRQLQNTDAGISTLFADYLDDFGKVKEFYAGDFRDRKSWKKVINRVLGRQIDRSTLVRVLTEQNKQNHCGIKTLANIDLLGNDNTVAVVTGQQIGICTGPLYTIYKAITAVKLAEQCSAELPEYTFVPVFWVEGEDHDFEEINSLNVVTLEGQIEKVEYLHGGKPFERNPGPVGALPVDSYAEKFFDTLGTKLQETEFKAQLFASLRGHYRSGSTMGKAFVGLMHQFFEESGLIFLDPNDAELKKIVRPVFVKEFSAVTKTSQLVIERSAELEERYHAQIKAKSLNLFMFHKGGRYLIEPRETDFSLKGTRQFFTKEELGGLIEQSPELFSPNVVLRPLCQDTLLPTAAYVGGPSEIAYFAQLQPAYEFFNLPMPIIYPRASVTILEEKIKTVLEKYQIEIAELWSDIDPLLLRIAEQVSEVKVDALFEQLQRRVKEAIAESRFGIQQIDSTLSGSVDSTLSRIESQLGVLKEKTEAAQQRRQDITLKQIKRASAHIFPNSVLQERAFNVVYFLNKYGPDFVRWLSGEVAIDRFQHQVIDL
ncbi:MAG TPA: bacillithiol biosynthesis cysteine-adding enzyme BshC [Bacteroidota bacterium]|nr:bacillithiol biosynthesis cysteine-adding enzyme BshC [Bacteroidota bacterium]